LLGEFALRKHSIQNCKSPYAGQGLDGWRGIAFSPDAAMRRAHSKRCASSKVHSSASRFILLPDKRRHRQRSSASRRLLNHHQGALCKNNWDALQRFWPRFCADETQIKPAKRHQWTFSHLCPSVVHLWLRRFFCGPHEKLSRMREVLEDDAGEIHLTPNQSPRPEIFLFSSRWKSNCGRIVPERPELTKVDTSL